MYEYFYGEQSNQFSFYRIPKILFTDEAFKSISSEAKILYGILLDRMSLSQKNGWTDDYGRVYIVFTVEEIMSSLGCQNQKAISVLDLAEAVKEESKEKIAKSERPSLLAKLQRPLPEKKNTEKPKSQEREM